MNLSCETNIVPHFEQWIDILVIIISGHDNTPAAILQGRVIPVSTLVNLIHKKDIRNDKLSNMSIARLKNNYCS